MRIGAAALAMILACGSAWAQAQPPRGQAPTAQAPAQPPAAPAAPAQPPGTPTVPQRTTATYEDWTVRCETRGTPPVKQCEMVQAVTAQGQANPVTQVAVGRAAPKDPVRMVFQLPVNVWIPAGVRFVFDTKVQPLAAGFKWCAPAGCFADIDLNNDLVKRIRAQTVRGRFDFKDAAQRDVTIPVSFKGFGQAFDALLKE
jgi:invasion protein IalB